ncbi:transcriptional regulator [Streptomyces tauricus]|uniref:TetR family transcriptional regulator n=1 Tax=Streptomyces tauricus TaxID=68274 RepID=A0ABZ1JGD7_9ACTN|nr:MULTISPECIES: TetR family transcriptional regulator [Streptomyces]MCW8100146.1 TetR family transcriptional regulator [Streptomyces tauricus]UPZ28831.1 TetR family transcriptional regulator [Streptomyces sp. LRE541]GHA51426.1 transcriptional regulator [Streptomyces tauricus]
MSHSLGVRQAQKQKTRQAFLDAALGLLAEQSLSSLGLREVTRAVGVAPTAFYRHFHSTADLGVALVEEALGSLHPMISGTVSTADDSDQRIDRAVALIARHVREHPAHIRFIARERNGGVQKVRAAIAEQMDRFADEVRAELAKQAESDGWSDDDLLMLAGLYVDQMLMTASAFLEADPDDPAEEDRVARVARRRMRLISIGRRHWLG